ncbi:MAG: hypothetical protein HYX33_00235 [Actinobacteria bacterium]|nr:hypothetical protein [Actinomycetota bacterium]
MAAHSDDSDLPVTWPFTFAALLTIVSMAWFTLGLAYRDSTVTKELPEGKHLFARYELFWGLLVVALVLVIGGAIFNGRRRARLDRASGAHHA